MNGAITEELDILFDKWEKKYPARIRNGYHRDGVINEEMYVKESRRVLFILLEPNSRKGKFDKYYGKDLRWVFGEEAVGKSIDKNIGIWTKAILDNTRKYKQLDRIEARDQFRRVAIMNLKKLSGSGKADYSAVSIQAWLDREYIKKEIEIISPELIVVCGEETNRIFKRIVAKSPYDYIDEIGNWEYNRIPVIQSHHPSVWANQAVKSFGFIREQLRNHKKSRNDFTKNRCKKERGQ
jgi:hypothetical protein